MRLEVDKERCCKRIFDGSRIDFNGHQCHRKAVKEVKGKSYCKIHNPEFIEKKNKERQEKWDRENIESRKKWRHQKAMVKACEGVSTEILENLNLVDLLNHLKLMPLLEKETK